MPGGQGGGAQAARELVACAEHTLAAPGARIELHREFSWPQAQWPRPRGCRGTVLRLAAKGGKLLVSAWWKLATRRLETTRGQEFGHLIGEGVAEPARGRYMDDFGSFAELHAGGTTYGRRPGRSVQVMRPVPNLGQAGDVLWLLRLLPGVTGAAVDGTDTVHGTACRRLAARVDMQRAPAAVGGGLRPPPVERFEQLRALPLTAWINGQHARRIRFEHGAPAPHRTTLELWDVGVPVENLDWSRLPAFRSPGYEHEPKPWYQRVLQSGTGPPRRSDTEPTVKMGRRFNGWLDRRTAWQFAVIYLSLIFPAVLIGGGAAQWWAKGHFDLAFLFSYAGIFAVSTSAAATFARHRRQQRQRSGNQRPPSRWWPWNP